jgi:hypothetical protein
MAQTVSPQRSPLDQGASPCKFFVEHRAPATFCLAKKFGEIDPRTATATYNIRILERKGEEERNKYEKSIPQKQKIRKGVGGKTEIKEIA